MRKDMRDRKDTRGTKYTYYNGCFLILLLIKSRLGTFPLLTVTGEHYEELKATCKKLVQGPSARKNLFVIESYTRTV